MLKFPERNGGLRVFFAKLTEKKFEIVLITAIIIYIAIFSVSTIRKNYVFNSYAWDLGVFNQVFHNTLFEGKFFQYNADLYLNPSGNYFAIHFSPILFLVLPFYYLFPSVEFLLIFKSLILALGAVPLFYLSKELLENKTLSLFISFTYLISPGLHGANWFDFQQQIFLPLFIFSMYYFFIKKRYGFYSLFFLLSIFVEEHIFSIIILVFTSYILISRNEFHCYLKNLRDIRIRSLIENRYTVIVLTIIFSVIYYRVSSGYIGSFNIPSDFADLYRARRVYEVLKYEGNTLLLPLYLVTHFRNTLGALRHDFYIKFINFIFIFMPTLFLPFLNLFCLFNLVLLLPLFLSNYGAYYMLGSHYPLYYLPSIYVSMIYTFKNNPHLLQKGYMIKNIALVSFILILVVSPVSPLSREINREEEILWYPKIDYNNETIVLMHEIFDYIPEDSSVLAQNHIFPHVSGRSNAFVIPIIEFSSQQEKIVEDYVMGLVNKTEYIYLDLTKDDKWSRYVFDYINDGGKHNEYVVTDHAVLYKFGESVTPIYLDRVEKKIFEIHDDMELESVSIVEDPNSISKRIVQTQTGDEGYDFYGPYIYVLEGTYSVNLICKSLNHSDGFLGTFEVVNRDMLLASRDIYGYEFTSGEWHNFTITLSLENAQDRLEFRFYNKQRGEFLFDSIIFEDLNVETTVSTTTFNYDDLYLKQGRINDDYLLENKENIVSDVFWYGPYFHLPSGNYTLFYWIKIETDTTMQNKPVILLDVTSKNGKKLLLEKYIDFETFNRNRLVGNWSIIKLDLTIDLPEIVEFRGITLNQSCQYSLGHILLEPKLLH